jgi:2,5-diketo-D-gluconate reductase A
VAAAHGVTVEQVVLRWHLQHEVIAIPKSARPERIAANFDIFGFRLDDADMTAIDAIGRARR